MWARQQISGSDVDYDLWGQKRMSLIEMSAISRSCIFTVDVYKGAYDYASDSFEDVFGIRSGLLKTVEKQGDLIEDLIHPADRDKLIDLQIRHGEFIYSLAPEERNDYRTIYQVRMRNTRNQYINVTSRQQVIETDQNGKAWIVMGMMEVSPDQTPMDRVKCSVLNLKTGTFFNPYAVSKDQTLTGREREILSLIHKGFLSKEIAGKLSVSIHTINNHRKNILAKLEADNAIEAINTARGAGLID